MIKMNDVKFLCKKAVSTFVVILFTLSFLYVNSEATCMIGTSEAAAFQQGSDPLQVLLITGGGPWHDYHVQSRQIEEGLKERLSNFELTIDLVPEEGDATDIKFPRHETDDWAREFDVVIYNHCHLDINDTDYVDRLIAAHIKYKVPAVHLHCSFHAYRDYSENWYDFLGGRSHRHEGHIPFTVEALDRHHPIMVNFPKSWRTPHGELYQVHELKPGAKPLARAYGILTDNYYTVAWTYKYHGVRVFNNTLGHHDETMGADVNLNLIGSGLLWAVDKLQDDGSPSPGYEGERGLGWISLLRDHEQKNLHGWRASGVTDWSEARRGNWPSNENQGTDSFRTENDKLIIDGQNSNLFYEGPVTGGYFRNFELKTDIYSYPESNSGIYFHTRFKDEGDPSYGYLASINASREDREKTGSLSSSNPNPVIEAERAPHDDQEWFNYYIQVDGKDVKLKVNGNLVTEYTETEEAETGINRGTVALQSDNGRVYFRNLMIRLWPD